MDNQLHHYKRWHQYDQINHQHELLIMFKQLKLNDIPQHTGQVQHNLIQTKEYSPHMSRHLFRLDQCYNQADSPA